MNNDEPKWTKGVFDPNKRNNGNKGDIEYAPLDKELTSAMAAIHIDDDSNERPAKKRKVYGEHTKQIVNNDTSNQLEP